MDIDQNEEQQLNDQLNGVEQDQEDQHQEDEGHGGEAGGAEDDNLEQEDGGDPPPRQESRAEGRIRRQQEELARARAEAEFYRRQAELAQQQRQQPEEDLDPDEKWRRQANAQIQQAHLVALDTSDQSRFLSKYSKDPEILSMMDEVEAKLADLRKQGGNAPRENILTFLLGQKALERRQKAPAVRKAAADRVQSARGQPLSSKSNVAGSKTTPSLYERLKDQPL